MLTQYIKYSVDFSYITTLPNIPLHLNSFIILFKDLLKIPVCPKALLLAALQFFLFCRRL